MTTDLSRYIVNPGSRPLRHLSGPCVVAQTAPEALTETGSRYLGSR